MKRIWWIVLALLLVAIPLVAIGASQPQQIPLKATSLIVEINSTDGDAGLQPSLDGDPWKRLQMYWPDGRILFDMTTKGELRNYGLTELFSESSEPAFTEFPLNEFKRLFPEGEYRVVATAIDGVKMVGFDTLTHDFPAGPEIISPKADAIVVPGDLMIEWKPVTQPVGINIVGYQVLVVADNPKRVFSADLPAATTTVTVPGEFLQAGTEYKVEVLAIEVSGNQTLSEIPFVTE